MHDRPVKRGDAIDLEVTSVAYGGDGLGRHNGRVVFVPFTLPGELVRVRVTKVHRSWLRAELIGLLRPAGDRVEPPCPYFGRCGGCAYQHVAYPAQLALKASQVAETLRRLGGFQAPPVEGMLPSPLPFGYRNRITVHVVPPDVGFRGTDPRRVVDIDRCLLADAGVNEALAGLRSRPGLRPGPATLRSSVVRSGFRQVNDGAAELLAGLAAEMAGTGPLLIDAYCGAGFFAKRLRAQFPRIVGLDWNGEGIRAAQADARPGEDYRCGDVAAMLSPALAGEAGAVVLLDPPAQGLAPEVVAALLNGHPVRLLYISCDPATLARDLRLLAPRFELRRVVPVDMFPQTASIETVSLLEAKASPDATDEFVGQARRGAGA